MRYYIGPHEGSGTADDPWRPPAGLVNSIDLRSLAAHTTPGIVLCVAPDDLVLGADYRLIAQGDVDAVPRGADRSVFASALGLPTVTGSTIADWLRDALTRRAEVDHSTRPPPLMPTSRRQMELHLNRAVRWDFTPAEAPAVQANLRAAYRRIRDESLAGLHKDAVHHRRLLEFWRQKYRTLPDRFFVPDGLPIEARQQPETTIGDTFTDTNGTALTSHTATGTGGGFSWSYLEGGPTWTIQSNLLEHTAAARGTARAGSSLSGDDHYSQVTLVNVLNTGVNKTRGVATRVHAGSTVSCYLSVCRDLSVTDIWQSYKFVSGTLSAIGSDTNVDASASDTINLESNGSTQTRYRNGVSQTATTDSSIPTNLYCGVSAVHAVVGLQIDDFIAADLGGGGGVTIPVLYRHRQMQGMS